jgi:hypothetical protein
MNCCIFSIAITQSSLQDEAMIKTLERELAISGLNNSNNLAVVEFAVPISAI